MKSNKENNLEKEQKINKVDNYDLEKEFNLRERRLKLVYRILYIVAALWASILIAYISITKSDAQIYCGILSLLTTFIINILYYVFAELRCMKISDHAKNDERNHADSCFLNIWNLFGLLLYLAVIITILNMNFVEMINKWSVSIVIVVGSVILSILSLIKESKIKILIKNITFFVVLYFFYASSQVL